MKPTYLYVKEHNATGLRYFGKTTRKDVHSYSGSGSYWANHLKVHGKDQVKTLWVSEAFTDEDDIKEFAELFSEQFDIVNSTKWANLIAENGLDGGFKPLEFTDEIRSKLSYAARNRKPISEETRKKMSLAAKNRSEEHKKNLSKSRTGLLLGRKMSEETKRKMSESQLRRRNSV